MALERKNVAQTELQSLDQQVAELESQQEKLTDSEQKLRTKIEAFRTKKEVIKAQYSAAEAQVRISEAATGVGEQMADVGLAMQRAVDKTEHMKARARRSRSSRRPAPSRTSPSSAAARTTSTASSRSWQRRAVDDELAKMKAELGAGSAAPRGQSPRPARASHDRPDHQRGRSTAARRTPRALDELDDTVVAAVDAGDEDGFHESFEELLDFVRSEGEQLADDDMDSSDFILPPAEPRSWRPARSSLATG